MHGSIRGGCFSTGSVAKDCARAVCLEDLFRSAAGASMIDRRCDLTLPSERSDVLIRWPTQGPRSSVVYQFASGRSPVRTCCAFVDCALEVADVRIGCTLGGGVGGGLILNVGVNEFVHDVRTGTARVEVTAELIERRGRNLVERKRFTASAPVAAENAPSAVAALSRALTTLFDELVPWLERTAEALPPPEPRPPRDGKS